MRRTLNRIHAPASGRRLRGGSLSGRALPLLAGVSLLTGLGLVAPQARAQGYSSPFALNLSAPVDWFADFAERTATLLQNSSPPPGSWTTHNYDPLPSPLPQYSWGPTNPQLYSVPQASIGAPALISQLSFDRGNAVYEVPIASRPAGVSLFDWSTQRLLGAAQQLIGTPYQHLHLPQFNPALVKPASNFTWNPVSSNSMLQSTQQLLRGLAGTQPNPYRAQYGQAAAGIDCTDFTAYIYSLALGTQLHSGTFNQITFPELSGGQVGGQAAALILDQQGNPVQPSFFYGPNYGTDIPNDDGSLDGLISQLQTGDLLYIGNRQGIVHVVMWLGALGINADGTPSTVPLVISSHDNTPSIFTTQDISFAAGDGFGFPSDGQIEPYLPPPGVQILPFSEQNWFYSNFQVAMRVLPSQNTTPVPAPAAPLWMLAAFAHRCRRLRRRARAVCG